MIKKCKQCGKEFNTDNDRRLYCSALCRKRASRARLKKEPQISEEQKKRWKEKEAQAEAIRKAFQKKVESGDLTARLLYLHARKPYSAEYWEVFREYDRKYGGNTVTTINGIRTDHPQFIEAVMVSIEEERRIMLRTERQNDVRKEERK